MADLSTSFASLVKSNNGMFKSAAQASFLLNQCQDGEFSTSGTAYGKGYTLFYTCDAKGVTKVQKQTVAKGLVTTWERVEAGSVAIQDKKEIARCKRQIKALEKEIAERQTAWDNGQYGTAIDLFNTAMNRDRASIAEWNARLASLV